MEPLISIQLMHPPHHVFQPHDQLQCDYQIDAIPRNDVLAVEESVLWYTEGKGDEDLGVHYFFRRTAAEDEHADLRQLRRFQTPLPASPLSYDGVILKIHWCVRVRVFLKGGREAFFEHPFPLGLVPPAPRPPEPAVVEESPT